MWVITYHVGDKYKTYKKWLRPASSYTVGKKEGTDIRFPQSWVSRKHLIFEVGEIDRKAINDPQQKTPLIVTFYSRNTTTLNGIQYKCNSEPISVDIIHNANTITLVKNEQVLMMTLEWVPVVFMWSKQKVYLNSESKDQLLKETIASFVNSSNIDVKFVNTLSPDATHFITLTDKASNKFLYSLAKLIPIVDVKYLDYMKEKVDDISTSFDNFPDNYMDFLPHSTNDPTVLSIKPARSTLLSGYDVLIFNNAQYQNFRMVIEMIGGRPVFYSLRDDNQNNKAKQEVVEYIKSNFLNNFLLLKIPIYTSGGKSEVISSANNDVLPSENGFSENSNDYQDLLLLSAVSKEIGIQLTDNSQLVESIKMADSTDLKKAIRVRKLGALNVQNEGSDLKKKKLNSRLQRRQVTKMDTLKFFDIIDVDKNEDLYSTKRADTEKIGQEEKINTSADIISPITNSASKHITDIAVNSIRDIEEEQNKSEKKSPLEQLPKITTTAVSDSTNLSLDNDISSSTTNDTKKRQITSEEKPDKRIHLEEQKDDNSKEHRSDLVSVSENPISKDSNKIGDSCATKVSFYDAVRSAKDKAIKRVKNDLGYIDGSTDSATEKLQNLAIVEEMDLPIRPRKADSKVVSNQWKTEWNGRKNFKVFKKAGSVKNMVSRMYVGMEEYDPENDLNQEDDFASEFLRYQEELEVIQNRLDKDLVGEFPTTNSNNHNENDADYSSPFSFTSGSHTFVRPTNTTIPSKVTTTSCNLFVSDSEGSDADFQEDLTSNSRVTSRTKISSISRGPVKRGTTTVNSSKYTVSDEIISSDDDDNQPRFGFTRKE